MTYINDQSNLTRPPRGNKPHVFKLIIIRGSNSDITGTIKENAVNIAQGCIIVEVKRLQVIDATKGMLIAMLPKFVNLKYVQEKAQECIIKAVAKTIHESGE